MSKLLDHERALLLVLREGHEPADAFEALLAHPEVGSYHLPPPWAFERAGVDLVAAMPDLRSITREQLPRVLDVLVRLHSQEALDAVCRQVWRETSEQVRAYFLKRPVGAVLAGIVRLGPRSAELPPPPAFVQAQVYIHRFEMQYRLLGGDETSSLTAPPEEGSLVLYPFDPANRGARQETELPEGNACVLECFSYAEGRPRHRRVLEDVAHTRGWTVLDSPQ